MQLVITCNTFHRMKVLSILLGTAAVVNAIIGEECPGGDSDCLTSGGSINSGEFCRDEAALNGGVWESECHTRASIDSACSLTFPKVRSPFHSLPFPTFSHDSFPTFSHTRTHCLTADRVRGRRSVRRKRSFGHHGRFLHRKLRCQQFAWRHYSTSKQADW